MNPPAKAPLPTRFSVEALDNDAPLTIARAYREQRHNGVRNYLIAHYRGDLYRHERFVYRKQIEEEIRADIFRWGEGLMVMRGSGDAERAEEWKPTSRGVNEVRDALAALCQVSVESMPAFIDQGRPDPADIIAFENGLLHVPEFIYDGSTELIPPTPMWFSENVLPYHFDSKATCPHTLEFLADVLNGDQKLIELLQEFLGYLLTRDTSQQKCLVLIGPPRSGKGTWLRMLIRVIGKANCASLRLASLADRFALEGLIGKTVAICPDAHLGRSADEVGVLERVKSIIGEDPQCIEQKYKVSRTNERMPLRIVLALNAFPDLPDSSAAMRSRMLIVPFPNSYEGREDRTLEDKLAPEAPGVMMWALRGLKRLREHGRFTEPEASKSLLKDFSRLSSPVLAFIEDCCRLDPDAFVECSALWEHWTRYCESTGLPRGTKQAFGLNLKSASPRISRDRKSAEGDGKRFWAYGGLGLTPIGSEDSQ